MLIVFAPLRSLKQMKFPNILNFQKIIYYSGINCYFSICFYSEFRRKFVNISLWYKRWNDLNAKIIKRKSRKPTLCFKLLLFMLNNVKFILPFWNYLFASSFWFKFIWQWFTFQFSMWFFCNIDLFLFLNMINGFLYIS